jgi:multiple sugar transport system permease protein/putative aldouronate transport system permease protein
MSAVQVAGRRRITNVWTATWKGAILIVACLLVVIPFLSVVSTSLADQRQITESGGFVLWPLHPSLTAYQSVLAGGVVTRALLVSVGITVVGTVISLACTIGLAYGLSRPNALGHRPLLMIVLFTLLFAPGIIPGYLVVQYLGLLNSYAALILPVAINAFNVIVMRSFFMDIPSELLDAARIDGANDFQVLWRVVIPVSRAVIAVVALFYAVAYWNSFFTALLYINDTEMWPMQLVVRTFVIDSTSVSSDVPVQPGQAAPPQQSLKMAILVLSILPILLFYPFLQRNFSKGALTGAVKG